MDPHELIGTWRFERTIHDRDADLDYTAAGDAEFTALPDGRIRWSEHGVLSWDGGSTPVERTLYLVRAAATEHPSPQSGAVWTVTFDDGHEFHPWSAGEVTHWCEPDAYSGVVSEPSETTDAWSITWTVTGPHKDYTMTTTYRPVGAVSV